MPKQKGGSKKVGRYKQKCEIYRKHQQKEKNALKHMLKSNCYKDAVEYAKKHGLKVPPQPTRRRSAMQEQREARKLT